MNIAKMREAYALLQNADALLAEAGVYDDDDGLACGYSLRDAIEDLDIDIERYSDAD